MRAVKLGDTGERTLGRLALSRGYATLERLSSLQYSEGAMTQLRLYVRDQFQDAARRMPRDPAPHLALARLFTYSLPDSGKALAEFAAAEQLGAKLGPREIRQREDARHLQVKKAAAAAHPPAKKTKRRIRWWR